MDEFEKKQFYGRLVPVLCGDVPRYNVQYLQPFKNNEQNMVCERCGSWINRRIAMLPNQQYYCRNCINLGRISTLVKLGTLPEPNLFKTGADHLVWDGELTLDQRRCANDVIEAIRSNATLLLWAVTGAGKTEMLFEGINLALKQGLRVCVASPRLDVCNELYPRFQEVFKASRICLLHGESEMTYEYAQFTICSTHQLLRFRSAFDVLIVDEVDAFPYASSPQLVYATKNAKKDDGTLIYLTATPGKNLLKQSKDGTIRTSYLLKRYHGNPLPVPIWKIQYGWRNLVERRKLSKSLRLFLNKQLLEKHQFLIFVPKISDLNLVKECVEKNINEIKVDTVYSNDPKRTRKVQKMRNGEIDGLITTTILERGVTFPKIDVMVLGADDPVFSMAALIQIAGRVGRSLQRPNGRVWFECNELTRVILKAINMIKYMNRKGFTE